MIEIIFPAQNQTLPAGVVIAEGIHGPPDSHTVINSLGGGGGGMPPKTPPKIGSKGSGMDWTLDLGVLAPGNYVLTVTKDQSSDAVDFSVAAPVE